MKYIEFIDVEIVLNNKEEGIPFVIQTLEELGTPRGSVLKVHDTDPSQEIPFGKVEGIAVYLDGVNLPDEVYATSDVNVVIEKIPELSIMLMNALIEGENKKFKTQDSGYVHTIAVEV